MSLRNHQVKIARAHHHLDEIQAVVLRWLDGDNYDRIHEYDRDSRAYRVYVEVKTTDGLDTLPPIIGDCLHNLRSALDHLALELAEAHSGPATEKVLQDSEFPIFGDEDRQGNAGKGETLFEKNSWKFAAVSPDARTFMKSLQPYQRGSDFRDDPLWRLYDLARVDRHRLLHVAAVMNTGIALKVGAIAQHRNFGGIAPGTIFSGGGELKAKERTKVFETAVIPIDVRGDVYVDVDPVPDVAFAPDTPGVGGESVVKTLDALYTYVINDVVLPLSRFL